MLLTTRDIWSKAEDTTAETCDYNIKDEDSSQNTSMNNTRLSQKFCNTLVHASLRHINHMTKTVQAIKKIPTMVGRIISFHAWFESHTDEQVMSSNSGTYALQIQTGP